MDSEKDKEMPPNGVILYVDVRVSDPALNSTRNYGKRNLVLMWRFRILLRLMFKRF
jgi:hypothetical protein